MPDALSSILPILGIGTAGAGITGNIMNSIQRGQVASQAQKNANLTPNQLATQVSAAEQPLDRSLVNTVNNQVQGDMAQRGLAEAPGIFAATEAGALAPYEQQNQQTALQLILQKLGLPNQTLAALSAGGGGGTNTSALLQMLMKLYPQSKQQLPGVLPAGTDNTAAILQQIQQASGGTDPSLTTPNNFTGTPPDTGGAPSI
jgi:hypothetical protein